MKDLSVIIPFANEHPQAAFTIHAIYLELAKSGIDFEVIAIDNWCPELASQKPKAPPDLCLIHPDGRSYDAIEGSTMYRIKDDGGAYLSGFPKIHPWFKVLTYDKKLSHWQAKNLGVRASTGRMLWFCDAHCALPHGSLVELYHLYRDHYEELNGTLHMPLSYFLEAPGRELGYKLIYNPEKALVHYRFTRYQNDGKIQTHPCMSTCGMMMSREIYETLGGWPEELGIYGGGENFINFTMAVLGLSVNLAPVGPLYHYAAKRGYNWNYTDYHRNRMIATYMFADADMVRKYTAALKGDQRIMMREAEDIIVKCRDHHDLIKSRQKTTIEEWVTHWPHITGEDAK